MYVDIVISNVFNLNKHFLLYFFSFFILLYFLHRGHIYVFIKHVQIQTLENDTYILVKAQITSLVAVLVMKAKIACLLPAS